MCCAPVRGIRRPHVAILYLIIGSPATRMARFLENDRWPFAALEPRPSYAGMTPGTPVAIII